MEAAFSPLQSILLLLMLLVDLVYVQGQSTDLETFRRSLGRFHFLSNSKAHLRLLVSKSLGGRLDHARRIATVIRVES